MLQNYSAHLGVGSDVQDLDENRTNTSSNQFVGTLLRRGSKSSLTLFVSIVKAVLDLLNCNAQQVTTIKQPLRIENQAELIEPCARRASLVTKGITALFNWSVHSLTVANVAPSLTI